MFTFVILRDLEQDYKEDFYTGTCAAIAGGFTSVFDMPNNKTPVFTKKVLDEKIKTAREKIVCNVGFYFGTDGHNLDEFKKIKENVFGLKIYMNITTGNYLIDWDLFESIYKSWPEENGPIFLHAEQNAIDYAIKIVKKIKKKTHVCHVNSKKDLIKILKAKNKGLPITVGVTPHHLFLTENDLNKLKSFGKMKPPLVSKADQDFLWKHIKDIDVIESDHAPHTKREKKANKPPFGVPGLETTLPLLLTAVNEDKIRIDDIKRLCFTNPKILLSSVHAHWTFHNKVVVDLDKEWVMENKNLKTKCGWSPFAGKKVIGKVKEVYIHKKMVFKDGKILGKSGSGKAIIR